MMMTTRSSTKTPTRTATAPGNNKRVRLTAAGKTYQGESGTVTALAPTDLTTVRLVRLQAALPRLGRYPAAAARPRRTGPGHRAGRVGSRPTGRRLSCPASSPERVG